MKDPDKMSERELRAEVKQMRDKKAMLTIDELSDHICEGIINPFQRAANFAFLKHIHAQLKEGGIWGWPDGQETYRKVGDGFVKC